MGEVYDQSGEEYYYGEEEYNEYGDQAVEVYDEQGYTEGYGDNENGYGEETYAQYTDNTEISEEYYGGGGGGGKEYYEEEIEEDMDRFNSDKTPLPAGWVEMYDSEMQAHYWFHEESGEASWVRPEEEEYDEVGAVISPPKRFGGDIKAYDYDDMTRTWNPNALATTGTAFATLRPRITPVVERVYQPGVENDIMGTKNIRELSEAEQEMKRLRVFERHLRIKGKSKNVQDGNKKNGKLPPVSNMGAPKAPFNPAKRAEIRGIVNEDLTRAKRELQVVQRVQKVGPLSTSSSTASEYEAGKLDGQVWSSTSWPVGPDGFAHPPAKAGKADFDVLGERALAEAWRRRRAPPPAEANRFALGVPEEEVEDTGPLMPSPRRQKFGDVMDHYALLSVHYAVLSHTHVILLHVF